MAELLFLFETDCPTCRLTVPYLNRLHRAWEPAGRVRGISQDPDSPTQQFAAHTGAEFPIEVDHGLELTAQLDPQFVPALYLVGPNREVLWSCIGFSKEELNQLALRLGVQPVADFYDGNPSIKAGCSSRHREIVAAGELLQPVTAKVGRTSIIDIPDNEDPWEFCRKLTGDPLPVVPPTIERVDRLLAATDLPRHEVVALVPPNYGPATVEKIAANAAMAGCPPDLMRVLIPLIRAACDEKFNLHGVQATTHFAAPLVVLNGPIPAALGFHRRGNVFSNVAIANSTLGRAFQLVLSQIGGARPGEIDMSTLGNPMKFAAVIAENEEVSPWEPLHVSRGFAPGDSTVTLFATDPPRGVSEHAARRPEVLLKAFCPVLATVWSYRACGWPEALVVLCPEHARTLGAAGWTRQQVTEFLWEHTVISLRDFDDDEGEGVKMQGMYERVVVNGTEGYRKFAKPSQITLVVVGGTAGKFSAVLGSWATGARGSQSVTYPIG